MEAFEDLKGFEGLYKINRAGQVLGVKGQNLLTPILVRGYFTLTLCKEGKVKSFLLHRLVALQFLPNTIGLSQIDHIDRDKTNNNSDNLRWISSRGNCLSRSIAPKSKII